MLSGMRGEYKASTKAPPQRESRDDKQDTGRYRSDRRVATRTRADRAPATTADAQIMLLICDYEPNLGVGYAGTPPEAIASARAASLARHGKRLTELAAPLIAQGLDVHTDARWDYPLHEAIVRKAVEWGADLVVKDTHHHSVLRRSIFSNTDWNLIRQCPTQLLLVKPRAIGHVPVVVAAVDPLHPRDEAASLDDRILASARSSLTCLPGRSMCFTRSISRRSS